MFISWVGITVILWVYEASVSINYPIFFWLHLSMWKAANNLPDYMTVKSFKWPKAKSPLHHEVVKSCIEVGGTKHSCGFWLKAMLGYIIIFFNVCGFNSELSKWDFETFSEDFWIALLSTTNVTSETLSRTNVYDIFNKIFLVRVFSSLYKVKVTMSSL